MIYGDKYLRFLICKIFFAVLINLVALFPSNGQEHIFHQESFSERFPLAKVNTIYQEQNGLIWLGTSQGLLSFDGINYQLLVESETKSISHICAGKEGEMLVGTYDGTLIQVVLPGKKAKIVHNDSIESRITGIVSDQERLIISTYGDGLWLLSENIWSRIAGLSEYPIIEIYDMAIDDKGRILIGTDDGLCIINNLDKKCEFLTVEDGLPDNIVKVVEPDGKGNIWLGFHQHGFCAILNEKIVNNEIVKPWKFGAISTINTQLDDKVFFGTDYGALLEYDLNAESSTLMMTSKNSGSAINDILIDREANIWITDHQNGLRKSSLYISFLDLPSTIGSNNVQSIFMDENNQLWFTTEEGLYSCTFQHDAAPMFKKHLDADVYGSSFISLHADNGSIWVGTFGVGLLYYHPESGRVQSYKEKHGLANNNVLSISGTKEKIWFATLGGVSQADKEAFYHAREINFTNYHGEDGLGTEYIYQVKIDSKGNPWFATDGKGLTSLVDGQFKNYSDEDGLDSKVIYSIAEDEESNIWLATPKNGIYKFDGSSFENYNKEVGFENKQFSSVYATNKSLITIHKFGIDLFQDKVQRSFGAAEGIGEINPDLNAITEDLQGNLWLGHQKGIINFNANLQENHQPEILINRILVNLEPMKDQENNILNYNENYLTFNYLGLWYSDPLKIKYEYKLEGITQGWISSRDNFVTFPNLPSGNYTFSVKASANDQFDHAEVASFDFEILAPYWEKFWFYVLLFLFISLLISGIFIIRDKSIKKKALIQQEKIQFQFETLKSQINPHFLFNSFNTLISIIEEEPKLATGYVEKLSDFFRNILMLREKDLISLREEIDLVMDYAFLQEKRFGQNFSLLINIPDRWLTTEIPPLTIQLLAENAIKHNIVSKNKPLTLHIYIDQNYLVIQNNIQLKTKAEASTNYGLENIIKRYKLLIDIPVEIINDEINFTIKLPLINT